MKEYINKDVVLTKEQKIGILASIIIVSGLFGWLYEFIFYYFIVALLNKSNNSLPSFGLLS